MKKIIKIIILIAVIDFLFIWILSLAKCEILTIKHGHEFGDDLFKENTMIGEKEYIKIINYTDTYARIYYVGIKMSHGEILSFSKENGQWKYENWERTVWSDTGSASEVIWPYWWHFIYGGL